MDLLASMGTGAAGGAAGGAATGATAAAGAGASAAVTGAATGGMFDGLIQGAGGLAKANANGAGAGTASQAFAKMFGGEVSDQTVQDLNTFQVGGQTKRKQEDPLDSTRQQFQDWMSLMSFTQ